MKVKFENQLRRTEGKYKPMYLLFGGNDTVPNSLCRGRGARSTECHLGRIKAGSASDYFVLICTLMAADILLFILREQ